MATTTPASITTASADSMTASHLSRPAIAGILTAVCLTISVLLAAMLVLLIRAITHHKRLVADLEARGIAVRPPLVGEVKGGGPLRMGPTRTVLRKNYLSPYIVNGAELRSSSSFYEHDKSRLSLQKSTPHLDSSTDFGISLQSPHIERVQDQVSKPRHIAECQISAPAPSHQTRFPIRTSADFCPPIPVRSSSRLPTPPVAPSPSLESRFSAPRSLLSKHDSAISGALSPRNLDTHPQKSRPRAGTASGATSQPDLHQAMHRTINRPSSLSTISRTQKPLNISEVFDVFDAPTAGRAKEASGHRLGEHQKSSIPKLERAGTPMTFYEQPSATKENTAVRPTSPVSKPSKIVFRTEPRLTPASSPVRKKNTSPHRVVLGEISSNTSAPGHASQRFSDSPSTRSSNGNPFRWELLTVPPSETPRRSSSRPSSARPVSPSKPSHVTKAATKKRKKPHKTEHDTRSPTTNLPRNTVSPARTRKPSKLTLTPMSSTATSRTTSPQPSSSSSHHNNSTSKPLPFRAPSSTTPSTQQHQQPTRRHRSRTGSSSLLSPSLLDLRLDLDLPPPLPSPPLPAPHLSNPTTPDPRLASAVPSSVTSPSFLSLFSPFAPDERPDEQHDEEHDEHEHIHTPSPSSPSFPSPPPPLTPRTIPSITTPQSRNPPSSPLLPHIPSPLLFSLPSSPRYHPTTPTTPKTPKTPKSPSTSPHTLRPDSATLSPYSLHFHPSTTANTATLQRRHTLRRPSLPDLGRAGTLVRRRRANTERGGGEELCGLTSFYGGDDGDGGDGDGDGGWRF
ncbi:hypothetical protein EJ05DRAFT_137751 [Pseudovirgaria hyperparasitica]|uniref:Uncharacterized protein n=1 Tax=Pseudovirgaria hyperparasitica TaxID=470096 RepID=A0A6A6VYZ2_9PEZI|nr:uncharacterized protein EJ05DRAFT_137751 [Pseudovirgaria hyperparasitica]KAF2754910.1 hypothetical protein EJ05DRAFT_137751 [Pseudovirgaria hyperparasitica]